METITNFTSIYSDIILKKIVQKIASDTTKLDNAHKRAAANRLTDGDARSQRRWKAESNIDFYYNEIEKGYERLRDLDEQVKWSDNLDQHRYEVIANKYPEVFEEYKARGE